MKNTNTMGSAPIALVLGFNIHGLAIARALSAQGIEVHAVSPYANMPANRTRFASVHIEPMIRNGDASQFLRAFASEYLLDRQAVLFPTNDRIVRHIASHWEDLPDNYLLSWANCAEQVLRFQTKDSLPKLGKDAGVLHPKSWLCESFAAFAKQVSDPNWPLIIKPAKPLAGFKAEIVGDPQSVERVFRDFPDDVPFVVQEYIDGDQNSLWFCKMYFGENAELASCTGMKLRAAPLETGQGTVMTAAENPEIMTLARKLAKHMDIRGPVSIEFKKDRSGRYWMIEPNVGRTEYCVDLAIQSGVNLPLIEYDDCLDNSARRDNFKPQKPSTWYDVERDKFCYIRHCIQTLSIRPLGKTPIFPYFGHDDRAALVAALFWPIRRRYLRLAKKIRRRKVTE